MLAKFVDPTRVGYYGLFTASIGYVLYLVGFDFYTYATREIIRAPAEQRGAMIKGQMALLGGLCLAVLLGSLAVLGMADWPAISIGGLRRSWSSNTSIIRYRGC